MESLHLISFRVSFDGIHQKVVVKGAKLPDGVEVVQASFIWRWFKKKNIFIFPADLKPTFGWTLDRLEQVRRKMRTKLQFSQIKSHKLTLFLLQQSSTGDHPNLLWDLCTAWRALLFKWPASLLTESYHSALCLLEMAPVQPNFDWHPIHRLPAITPFSRALAAPEKKEDKKPWKYSLLAFRGLPSLYCVSGALQSAQSECAY